MYLPGRYIVVRFGREGTQIAQVIRLSGTSHLGVRKYRRNSGTWTSLVRVGLNEVIRAATIEEIGSVPVPPKVL